MKNIPPRHINHPTYLQKHPNHGTIVLLIWRKTMASMVEIPRFQPRDPLTNASFGVDPAAFSYKLFIT